MHNGHPCTTAALNRRLLPPALEQAVYTTLREAEYRSTYPIAYWNIAPLRYLVSRFGELGWLLGRRGSMTQLCQHLSSVQPPTFPA